MVEELFPIPYLINHLRETIREIINEKLTHKTIRL